MALKKLPGGVIVETEAGARLNEEAGINLEAIHRQLGAQAAAALDALKTKADVSALAAVRDTARAAQSTAQSAQSSASAAVVTAGAARDTATNADARVTALESVAGFGPSTPVDGQTASLVLQPDTQTRAAVDTAAEQVTSMRVGPTRVDVASHARTADRAGVQAVIDAHGPGTEFYFSAAFPGGELVLSDGLGLASSAPGQRFAHDRALTIRQTRTYAPAWDILHDDVTVHDLTAVGPNERSANGPTWRKFGKANYSAGVYVCGHRTRVTGKTRVTNLKNGACLTAWDHQAQAVRAAGTTGVYIEDLDVTGGDFGVLAYGQRALTLGSLTTRDHIDSSGGRDPNHGLYIVGGAEGQIVRNGDVQVGTITTTGLTYGAVVQVKECDGLHIGSALGSKVSQLINLMDVSDWNIGSLIIRDTIKPTLGVSPLVWTQDGGVDTSSPRVVRSGRIESVIVSDPGGATAGQGTVKISGRDVSIGSLFVETVRASGDQNYSVALDGTRVTVDDLRTVDTGTVGGRSLSIGGIRPAEGVSVARHASHGATLVAEIASNATGTTYGHSPERHTGGRYSSDGLLVSGEVTISRSAPGVTRTGASLLVTPVHGDVVATAQGITINLRADQAREGQRHTIKNATAGTITIKDTGGGVIDASTAVTVPAWGAVRVLRTGGAWVTL